MPKDKSADKNLDFEKALSELEIIVKKMEDKQLPLNNMMELFEKGKKLSTFCSSQLSNYEKKIEFLISEGDSCSEDKWKDFESEKLL